MADISKELWAAAMEAYGTDCGSNAMLRALEAIAPALIEQGRREGLVRAGALILAEIERLDRADAIKAEAERIR